MNMTGRIMKSIFAVACSLVATISRADFTIDNIKPGDTVRYPLVILKGSAEGSEMAVGTSWKDAVRFPVIDHHFVAVVQLKPGKNMLLLHAGSETMKFRLDYSPMTTPYKLFAVYVTALDQPNNYYTTNPKDRFDIRDKMDLEFKLMQSVCAEQMHQAGFGRKTFGLEFDKSGKVEIHFVKSPKSAEQLRSMDDQAIYSHIDELLEKEFPSPYVKWCGLLGFASFDAATKKAVGHLALGGGRQALFGAASMQWWPASIKELPKALVNTTAIDPQVTFEDSGNRGTVWANVWTAYGACLHEVGHTFDLPHSSDPFSIMSRGFDFFGRQLMPMEPPVKSGPWTSFKATELPKWDAAFAAQLNLSHWFQPELTVATDLAKPEVSLSNGLLTVNAPAGIAYVGVHNDALADWFSVYKPTEAPKTLKLSVGEIRQQVHSDNAVLTLVVIDGNGNRTSFEIKP